MAVLLLAGLVAVPVVLTKSSEEPPAPLPRRPKRRRREPEKRKGLATVTLEQNDDRGRVHAGHLRSQQPVPPAEQGAQGRRGTRSRCTTAPAAGPGNHPRPEHRRRCTTGGDDGPTGDDRPAPATTAPATRPTTTTLYTYVIDVTFTANGRTRKIKGMQRLDMLPNADLPLLLFLGVSPNGGNAVFGVDASLEPAGEGTCKPSKTECAFLYLGPGSKHKFHKRGRRQSYELASTRSARSRSTARPPAASKDDQTASAAVGTPTASTAVRPAASLRPRERVQHDGRRFRQRLRTVDRE